MNSTSLSVTRTPLRFFPFLALLLLSVPLAIACGGSSSAPSAEAPPPEAAVVGDLEPNTEGSSEAEALVVFLGDSLTAGYGLAEEQAFPALVGERLAEDGLPVRVVNAGVSGDTSAGGLARIDWILRQQPDVMVVELGPNDGLRGQPLAGIEDNLRQIIVRSRQAGAKVLLVGMQLPPSLGPEYTQGFRELYSRLASDLDVPLVPFLLEGVGGEADLNLADGIHPNARGHRRIADTVTPYLQAIIEDGL